MMSNIIPVLLAITTFIAPISMFIGVVFFIISFFNKDDLQKKNQRKLGLWLFFGPLLVLFVLVTLFGIIGAVTG